MIPIQYLNRILNDAYRRAELALRRKVEQNKKAKTRGYNNNNDFEAKPSTGSSRKVDFTYNAGLPRNRKVVIDDLDTISSQSSVKRKKLEEYKELDKSYNYEYFQISRRDGFCAILRIGVLKTATSESLREKNKRIKAKRKASGSPKKDKIIAHIVVLTYGAVWEPENVLVDGILKVGSLKFNEQNWTKLFTPGLIDSDYILGKNPGSCTSVRFWEKSSIIANGVGTSTGVSEFPLSITNYTGSGSLFPSFYPPTFPFTSQFVLDLHKGVCDFAYIRENTPAGTPADTKFSIFSEKDSSHQILYTTNISGGSPQGESFGEFSFNRYEKYNIGSKRYIDAQISWGAPLVIDRTQTIVNARSYLEFVGASTNTVFERRIFDGSVIYPKGYTSSGSWLFGSQSFSRGANQEHTKLAVILDGTNSTGYVAKQDNTDPSNAGSENDYTSNVFVLPDFSVEVHGEKLWLNYYTTVSGIDQEAIQASALIWSDWNNPYPIFSFTDPYWNGSLLTQSQSVFYVIEDNSGAKDKQKLCRWCVSQRTSNSSVTYSWIKNGFLAFKANPLSGVLELKSTTINFSNSPGDPEVEYTVSSGTGYLSDTYYSNLTGGLLPLLRYAESSYALPNEKKITVKLTEDGDLYACKPSGDRNFGSTEFSPLVNNGTPGKLIPFKTANIADRLELPDTSIYPSGESGASAPLFTTMPLEIQTIPSSARSVATMYFKPENYNLTASLGIISMGGANFNGNIDDTQVSIDESVDVLQTAQYKRKIYYYG
jgi:hypothetical protein